jgi:hypothetical protein
MLRFEKGEELVHRQSIASADPAQVSLGDRPVIGEADRSSRFGFHDSSVTAYRKIDLPSCMTGFDESLPATDVEHSAHALEGNRASFKPMGRSRPGQIPLRLKPEFKRVTDAGPQALSIRQLLSRGSR